MYVRMNETTVRLDVGIKKELDSFRQYKSESYGELIKKIMFIAKTAETDPETSQEEMKDINKMREKIKTSGRYSDVEIKKILGDIEK